MSDMSRVLEGTNQPAAHCAHARECPGCPSIAEPIEVQRDAKRQKVCEALARFPELAAIATRVEETSEAQPITGYRTRAKLMVGGRGRGDAPRLGLYREGTHDVVDVPGCVVLAPVLAEVATRIRALLRNPPAAAEGALAPSDDRGALEAIDLREVVDEQGARALVTLVLDRTRLPHERAVHAAADAVRRACPQVASIAINLRGHGPQVLGAETMWCSARPRCAIGSAPMPRMRSRPTDRSSRPTAAPPRRCTRRWSARSARSRGRA